MTKYFSILNDDEKVIIDDTTKFFVVKNMYKLSDIAAITPVSMQFRTRGGYPETVYNHIRRLGLVADEKMIALKMAKDDRVILSLHQKNIDENGNMAVDILVSIENTSQVDLSNTYVITYGFAPNIPTNFGLELRNANNEIIYNSNNKLLKILGRVNHGDRFETTTWFNRGSFLIASSDDNIAISIEKPSSTYSLDYWLMGFYGTVYFYGIKRTSDGNYYYVPSFHGLDDDTWNIWQYINIGGGQLDALVLK